MSILTQSHIPLTYFESLFSNPLMSTSEFEASRYFMHLNSEGYCGNMLIFVFGDFTERKSLTMPTRRGAFIEIQNLKKFAQLLSLKPRVFFNLSKQEMKDTLTCIANPPKDRPANVYEEIWNARIKPDHSTIFVAVVSHGNSDSFLTADGKLFRDTDIDSYLNEDNCLLMKGKPKTIFLNKCRIKGEVGHETRKSDSDTMRGDEIIVNGFSALNFLHIYSCSMGTPSLSNTETGSLVISALSKEYEKYGKGKEFRKFIQIFRSQMIEEVNTKVQNSPYANTTQCITTERDSLLKDIYFPQTVPMTASDCLEEMEVEPSFDFNIHKASWGSLHPSVVEDKPKNNRLKFLRRMKTPRVLRPHGQKMDHLKELLRRSSKNY